MSEAGATDDDGPAKARNGTGLKVTYLGVGEAFDATEPNTCLLVESPEVTLLLDCGLAAVARVWEGLDFHEREAFDLMGIEFPGHPRLERVLLPQDFKGHPLRKDYIYQIKEEVW